MHFIRAVAAGLYLLVCGCASTYEAPKAVEAQRASLDATGAAALLASALSKTDEAHGLCSSNVRLDRSSPNYVEMKNGVMIFEDYTKKDRDPDVARDFPSLDMKRDRFEFDFRGVSQVRVLSPGAVSSVCARAATNRQLGLKDAKGMFINVDLPAGSLDPFMAAVLFYSPQARVAQGFGL